ncbi:MAG TPA: tyrosine-type recombinase/integrase [Dermatophilaceae bacterium]|nr:tyrosine-type recombinase/integrase [Dermatophilaceae bacterium]
MTPSPTVPYAATVERFLQRLSNEGRSARTLAAYRYDLDDTMLDVAVAARLLPARPALDAMAAGEREAAVLAAYERLDVAALGLDDLDQALAEFRTRPDPRFARHPERAPQERSPATVARRTAALRSFFAWCYRTERIAADPAALLRPPKKRKRMPRAIDGATAGRALAEAGEASTWPERDLVIMALALACGLRLDEIARLRVADLEGQPPVGLVVRGKGDKERRLGVPPVVQEALAAYLPTRQARLHDLGLEAATVVVSSRPRPVRDRRGRVVGTTVEASRDSVIYVVDRVLRQLGARRAGVRVHALRHTFATLGLREGAFSLRQLQVALGHASLATTQIYTEVADEEIAAAMRLHPLGGATRRPAGGR